MTLDEIKAAVECGDTVHWSNEGYTGQWFIAWNLGGTGENLTGLTHQDGVTLNGEESEFYIARR